MASTGSVVRFRRTAVSAYRLLCIHGGPEKMRPFSSPYSTNVTETCLFHAVRNRILATSSRPKLVDHRELFNIRRFYVGPIMGSLSIYDDNDYLTFNTPAGLEKTESDEGLCVFLCMHPEVTKDDVKVCVEDNTLLHIYANTQQVIMYLGIMRLPDNVDKTSSHHIKGDIMPDGRLKLTFPNLIKDDKQYSMTTSIFSDFMFRLRHRYKFWLLHRHLVHSFTLYKEVNSFTLYKEVTNDSLHIRATFGLAKMELTSEGACVSLKIMPQLKIEDVKSYFKGDTLLIEGKTKTKMNKVHYITSIRLPESILKKRNMIKTEMRDGVYKATLPYAIAEIKIN